MTLSGMRKKDERGASAVEYALIVALCAAAFILAAWAFQGVVEQVFDNTACDSSAGYSCNKS